MARLDSLSLDELYEREKLTPSVLKNIRAKGDFTQIDDRYCDRACTLPCKKERRPLLSRSVDVLFVMSHLDSDTKYRTGEKLDQTYRGIVMGACPTRFNHAFTSAYRCRQTDTRHVKTKDIRTCSVYLQEEIRKIGPRVIVALGPRANEALGVKADRGELSWINGIPVISTLDPRVLCMIRQNASGEMWGPDYFHCLENDMKKVALLLEGRIPPARGIAIEVAKTAIHVVRSLEEVDAMMRVLERESVVSFDIETTGLDPWSEDAKILMAQFGKEDGSEAWVVTLWHREWDKYSAQEAWKRIVPLLTSTDIHKVGHNIQFDVLYCWAVKGVRVVKIHDTMQYLHSLNSGIQGQYGLKTAVWDWLFESGLGGYEDELGKLPAGKTYEDFPLDKLQIYAGIDALCTARLRSKLVPLLRQPIIYHTSTRTAEKRHGVGFEVTKYKTKALNFLIDLSHRGIGFSLERNLEMRTRVERHIAELEQELKLDFSPSSGPQLMEYLYTRRGFAPISKTKSGLPSVDSETLADLAEIHNDPSIGKIAILNELNALNNTFLKQYASFVKRDGRIHPQYNLHGTSSFRISAENPNPTQIPDVIHGYSVRSCFIPREGHLFLVADYSSAEVKILGAISRDERLLEAIRQGWDFHSYTAARIAGMSYEEFVGRLKEEAASKEKRTVYKAMRQAAKAITFAILYGSAPLSVALQLGISIGEAENLFKLYFEQYPGIRSFIERAHLEARLNKFILTPFGQTRRELGLRDEFKGTAVYNAALRNSQNAYIQSPTSTLGLIAFAETDARLSEVGGYAVCTVYDSVEAEILSSRKDESVSIVKHTMNDWVQEQFPWVDFPIGVDVEVGESWGQLHKA